MNLTEKCTLGVVEYIIIQDLLKEGHQVFLKGPRLVRREGNITKDRYFYGGFICDYIDQDASCIIEIRVFSPVLIELKATAPWYKETAEVSSLQEAQEAIVRIFDNAQYCKSHPQS